MDPEFTRGSIAAALMNQQGIPAPVAPPNPVAPNLAPSSLPAEGIVAPSGVLQVPNMPFSIMPAGGGSPYLGYDDKPYQGAPSPMASPSPAPMPSPAAAPMPSPSSAPQPIDAPASMPPPAPAAAPAALGGGRGGSGIMPAAPPTPTPTPPPQPFFGGADPAPPPSSAPYQKPSGELVVPDMPFSVMMPSALYGPYGKYGTAYDRGS